MNISVCSDIQQVAVEAANIFKTHVNNQPKTTLGLATGRTPMALYSSLIEMYRRREVSFARVTTFNLDEYCGEAPESSRSFRYYMHENFFNHIDLDPTNIHFPSCSGNGPLEFEDCIRSAGGIDLQMLGIGINGHIAFNEPGSSFSSRTRTTPLSDSTLHENFPGYGSDDHDLIPTRAVTMGVGTILEAEKILLLATGRQKAQSIHRALEGPLSIQCPASALQLHSDVSVVLDRNASSQLSNVRV